MAAPRYAFAALGWAAILWGAAGDTLGDSAPPASIHVWPTSFVVGATVRLDEVSTLNGFAPEREQALARLRVISAPAPGGSTVVSLGMIRDLLESNGVNMAGVLLRGATNCVVRRPTGAVSPEPEQGGTPNARSASPSNRSRTTGANEIPESGTLRSAVQRYFDEALTPYRGRAEIDFDRASEPLLDLTGDRFTFRVRREGTPILGMIPVHVDVLEAGRIVQSAPMVVRVRMLHPTVVAQRPISQGAAVRATDVATVMLTVSRLGNLGVSDASQVIGQQAKRFVRRGEAIQAGDLEPVPLVLRGQLVTLTSVAGGVHVVTTAKAAHDGLWGEAVRVRSLDKKRTEFDTVVVGPGRVRVGDSRAGRNGRRLVAAGEEGSIR